MQIALQKLCYRSSTMKRALALGLTGLRTIIVANNRLLTIFGTFMRECAGEMPVHFHEEIAIRTKS